MKYINDKGLEFLKQISSSDLDPLVQLLMQNKKGNERFTEELTSEERYKKHSPNHNKYWDLIAAEIQCFGANSIATIFRGGKGIPYREILADVCNRIGVKYYKNNSVLRIEMKLILYMINESLLKMETKIIKEFVKEIDLKTKNYSPAAVTIALERAIKHDDYISFQLAAIVANGIVKEINNHDLLINAAFLNLYWWSGPIGLTLAGIWALTTITGPAYRVIIPSVFLIAFLRLNLKYALPDEAPQLEGG